MGLALGSWSQLEIYPQESYRRAIRVFGRQKIMVGEMVRLLGPVMKSHPNI